MSQHDSHVEEGGQVSMGFMTEIKLESAKAGNTNKIKFIEEKLGKKDFEEFLETLDDHSISCGVIARVLKARGVTVSENSIRKYRSGREPR